MFILKNGHQPGVYVPLRALFLVKTNFTYIKNFVLMALSLLHTYMLLESLHKREGILARVSSYIDFPETSRGS